MISIPKKIIEKIAEHAKRDYPIEACGYLTGKDGVVSDIIKMTNTDKSNEHFSFDPNEQFQAVKYARSRGESLIAVYHSHPETPARMSKEDIRLANDVNMKYIIYSVKDDDIKCFSIDKDKNVSEVKIAPV
ncbi:Mov34/MPN/PAD-1 family protein [Melioribacter roseus P3M-2]|uniref:Mov34/MPN/PAD-1 family protein n=1 Tax=Melioribacter roseus (strain DSM 23840 / JCM 17771 / VKM B-2668 / P3M-2) TaxID=1191523 RepID=I7A2G4_MELRP|nr:M67 family metallopeptidase [Melioribacter roseus]AFN74116.1 Mov34/MPN/PAD-1 family protein [Melioribacter roseus P3M-2]